VHPNSASAFKKVSKFVRTWQQNAANAQKAKAKSLKQEVKNDILYHGVAPYLSCIFLSSLVDLQQQLQRLAARASCPGLTPKLPAAWQP